MELEATQAAGLVLGVKSYGASDELDYHSAWDMIKVAAEAEHGLLKKRPALADVAHDEGSNTCRAKCANGRPCNNQVHPNAGQDGHCAWTCGLHKNKRPEDLRAPEDNTQRPDEETPPPDDGEQSDADIVVSDSDDEDDLFARDNVNAEAAAGMADEGPPVARVVGGKPPRNREQPRPQTDLLKVFNADGGTTTGSSPVYQGVDGKPVPMCSAFNYAYRDSRLHAFTPVEFRQRFKVEKMDKEQQALRKMWCSAARYISAWWRLEDRRGRAAAHEQWLYDVARAAAHEQRLYDVAESPMAVEMTSSDDESEVMWTEPVEFPKEDTADLLLLSSLSRIELEHVLKQAKGKRDDLYEKLKVVYKYDLRDIDAVSDVPPKSSMPKIKWERLMKEAGIKVLEAHDRREAASHELSAKQVPLLDKLDLMQTLVEKITDAIDSPPSASPRRLKVRFDPCIAAYYGVLHPSRAARYIQAAWRLRHYRPVIHHRLRSFHVMRGSWLRSKLMMATQTFLALCGSVAPSERKRPYGKRLLAITSLSPPYHLPITSLSPGGRVVLSSCAPPAPRSIHHRAANEVGCARAAG